MIPKETMKEQMKNTSRRHVVQLGFVLDLALMTDEHIKTLLKEVALEIMIRGLND